MKFLCSGMKIVKRKKIVSYFIYIFYCYWSFLFKREITFDIDQFV